MKLWLTAQEIADEALPDMPTTKRRVNAFAARNGWQDGRGKARRRPGARAAAASSITSTCCRHGRGWPISAATSRRQCPNDLQRAAGSRARGRKPQPAAAAVARDARLYLVDMADRFHRGSGLAVVASDRGFVDLFNHGSMPVPPWVREAVGRISERSIARWRSAIRAGTISALAVDRGASRKGTGVLDRAEGGAVRNLALALLAKNPLLTAKHIRATVRDRFGENCTYRRAARSRCRRSALSSTRSSVAGRISA